MRGIEADIPRTLTKHSHVHPLLEGEGWGEGEGFVRFSIASSTLQVTVPIPPKIAENHQYSLVLSGMRDAQVSKENPGSGITSPSRGGDGVPREIARMYLHGTRRERCQHDADGLSRRVGPGDRTG